MAYPGSYLANSFRRATEAAVSQAFGINPAIVRNAGNGNWGRAAEIGIMQGTQKGIRHIQREERQFNNTERIYERAEDRWRIMQERHRDRPNVLEKERQRYEAAQERYKEAYQERYGKMPPGHEEKKQPVTHPPQPQAAAPLEHTMPQTPVAAQAPASPAQSPSHMPLPPSPAAEPVLTEAPERPAVTMVPIAPAPAAASLERQETMQLQAGLKLMGIETGPIDGIAGPKTAEAVAEYTARNPALAGAGPHEILAHVRAQMQGSPDVQSAMTAIVAQGAQADTHDARAVQVALNDLGRANLSVDGTIGTQTVRAFAGYMESSYDSMTGKETPQLAQNEIPAPLAPAQPQPAQQRPFNPAPGVTI